MQVRIESTGIQYGSTTNKSLWAFFAFWHLMKVE